MFERARKLLKGGPGSGNFGHGGRPGEQGGSSTLASPQFKLSLRGKLEGRKLVSVSTGKLDAAWSKDKELYIPPGGGGAEIPGRRDRFRSFLDTGKPIEASEVYWDPEKKSIHFGDGRHRFTVLRDIGLKRVKVSVKEDQVDDFKRFLRT
jgi:hypothetical protein